MKHLFIVLALFNAIVCFAAEKTVVANNGSGWSNDANWSPSGVPQNNDVVNIPAGTTITVKGEAYNTPTSLIIKVNGTLDFDPSGRLDLSIYSYIQLFVGGKITSNGTNSEVITIGGAIKYSGRNDGTITGPKFTSIASPNSISGSPGAGFEEGILPVKIVGFDYKLGQNQVEIRFTINKNSDEDLYILEKLEQNTWMALKTFKPLAITQKNEYTYTDKFLNNSLEQYRLKIITENGISSYSKILKVQDTDNSTHMIVYPNPSSGQTRIQWDNKIKPDKIIVYDMLSKVVLQDQIHPQKSYYDINLFNMRNGHYYVTLLKENIYIGNTQIMKK